MANTIKCAKVLSVWGPKGFSESWKSSLCVIVDDMSGSSKIEGHDQNPSLTPGAQLQAALDATKSALDTAHGAGALQSLQVEFCYQKQADGMVKWMGSYQAVVEKTSVDVKQCGTDGDEIEVSAALDTELDALVAPYVTKHSATLLT